MMNAMQIAGWVLDYARLKGYTITNNRLQRILYYLYGYMFHTFRRRIFDDEFQAWGYGPVVPMVYFAFSPAGTAPIVKLDFSRDMPDRELAGMIAVIVDKVMEFSMPNLIKKTRSEIPAAKTANKDTIDRGLLETYFVYHDPLSLDSRKD